MSQRKPQDCSGMSEVRAEIDRIAPALSRSFIGAAI